MSKKSSTFAPDMKKMYHIPVMEIMTLETKRIMDMGDPTNHDPVGGSAPAHHGLGPGGATPF